MNDPLPVSVIAAVTVVAVLAGLFGAVAFASATAAGPSGTDAGAGSEPAVETLVPATETATDSVTNTTENATETVTDTMGTVTDATDSVTDTTENTTESLTNTTEETVENTTGAVANTTDDTESTLANESVNLVGDGNLTATVSLGGTASVGSNASVGANASAGLGGETTTVGQTSGSTPESGSTAAPDDEDPASTQSGPTTDSGGAGPASGESEGHGDSSLPSPSGAAAGGVLVLAGVVVAAGSKHVAASTSAAQGQELAWLARAVRLKAQVTADALRGHLGRLPRVVLPPGYSRHDDSDPLGHETRCSLFETVERSPGVNLSTLADGTDASLSTVRHHLRVLEEEHLLVSERIRGQRRYFLSNESDPALVAALDDTATEPILRTLARSGPASVSDLADALGRDPSTISHHVSRLEDDGLVERERDGRSVRNSLAPVAERVLSQSESAGGQQRSVATE